MKKNSKKNLRSKGSVKKKITIGTLLLVITSLGIFGCFSIFTNQDNINTTNQDNINISHKDIFIVKLTETGTTTSDFYYLSVIAAGSHLNDGTPAVLAIENNNDLNNDLYIENYLSRYKAEKAYTINFDMDVPYAGESIRIDAASATNFSKDVALKFWTNSLKLVAVEQNSYEDAIQGAAMAAHLNAPLIYYNPGDLSNLNDVIQNLHAQEVISIGSSIGGLSVSETNVNGPVQIIDYLNALGKDINYYAVTNGNDPGIINNDGPKLSLSAPLIAARRKGVVVPIQDTSSPTMVYNELKGYYSALGYHPKYLAIVASHTGIPMHFEPDPGFTSSYEIGTDFHYSNVDTDLFPEIAIGRLNSENIFHGSLVTSRISTYDDLKNGIWDQQFIQCGSWDSTFEFPLLAHHGYNQPEYLVGQDLDHHDIEAKFIVHNDHSNHVVMGNAFYYYEVDSVLSPTVIISTGCSVAGIYQQPGNAYISRRLQRLGSVSFVGTTRPGTSTKDQTILGFLNKILQGQPLGDAFKYGVSTSVIRQLNEPGNNFIQREIWNLVFYGDPAMIISNTNPSVELPLMSPTTKGVKIDIPNDILVGEYSQIMKDEWGYNGTHLYNAEIPGIDSLTNWGPGYDVHKQVYTAVYHTTENIISVNQVGTLPSPLGKVGLHHVDYHQDGSRTVYWHVRVLDYNQETGVINNKINSIEFEFNT